MRRPRSSTAALLAAISAALGACGDDVRRPLEGPEVPAPPAPVIGDPEVRAELGGAKQVAREFLGGYLAYLYGRGRAARVPHVSATVRGGLARTRARETPAQRPRRPRTLELKLVVQRDGALIATALVADGGVAPHPLTFTLAHRGERWLVNSLGSD